VETVVDASAFGLAAASLTDLKGGDAAANANYARRILGGQQGPQRDVVVLNAAAGLVVGGRVADLSEGVALAQATLDSGAAEHTLARLVEVSQGARPNS
jgi:anthranilate phosphoribosyltransferase